jgi:DNA (cytosine-5)-methyltransferase 1
MLTFLSIADKFRPKWVVWENVPGVLSSNGGRDFGTFLGALGELGYGFAYRVLDAQYFGVAQRRRRVFVVGYLGDWRVAAAVLFERESLQGNTKPSRKKREEVTANAQGSVGTTVFAGNQQSEIAATLQTTCDNYSRADGFNVIIDRAAFNQGENAQYEPRIETGETMSSLVAKGPHAVAQPMAFDWQSGGDMRGMSLQEKTQLQRCQTPAVMHSIDFRNNRYNEEQIAGTLQSKESGGYSLNYTTGVHQPPMAIRRLTPKECERLQGFPDDWTKIPYRNKEADQCPDGPRYKACGNSMAVPVMRWIGERINLIESML